jgi:DNA-binding beta-propeller fold protein YncE
MKLSIVITSKPAGVASIAGALFAICVVGCGATGPAGRDSETDDATSVTGAASSGAGAAAGGAAASGSGGGAVSSGAGPAPPSSPVLGDGTHSESGVEIVTIATASEGLSVPRDLAFNPQRPGELWIVNRGDESVVVLFQAGEPSQSAKKFATPTGEHFLAQPAALAFNTDGTFATIHETSDPTQGGATPSDFMGPTLWTSNLSVFDAGDGGHIDMLHNSPLGMGIAWQSGNKYWVLDGYHASITRYDFGDDHGPGGTDHGDGVVARFVEGQVKRKAGVPSHLAFAEDGKLLYVADTGNGRIAVLDTTTGTKGASYGPNYDGGAQYKVTGASLSTLVEGVMDMTTPCGLAVAGNTLFVTDNASSTIFAFDLQGKLIDWLPLSLPAGSLMGIAFDGQGRLYCADAVGARVLRIAAKAGGTG